MGSQTSQEIPNKTQTNRLQRTRRTKSFSDIKNKDMKVELNLILIGKKGQGNSATGNSLLSRKAFKTSAAMYSESKDISSDVGEFLNYKLTVVDGFRLGRTDVGTEERLMAALRKCAGSVDAFLFVTKFSARFTENDKFELDALKQILGDKFMDHVIVVVTHRDLYDNAMEDERRDIRFSAWCKEQGREFSQLYDNCKGRVVLMNNRERREEKKQAQNLELLRLANNIQIRHGRYINTTVEQPDVILPNQTMPEFGTESNEITCLSHTASNVLLDAVDPEVKKLETGVQNTIEGQGVKRCQLMEEASLRPSEMNGVALEEM